MKKLMILGGSRYAIPVIEIAHKLGLYVITCDYLPDNIAHKYSCLLYTSFSDPSYRKKLHNLKNFGINGPEDVEDIGGNAKLDEFRAAMGICNLRRMDECINARRKIYERYVERFSNISGIKPVSYTHLNVYKRQG